MKQFEFSMQFIIAHKTDKHFIKSLSENKNIFNYFRLFPGAERKKNCSRLNRRTYFNAQQQWNRKREKSENSKKNIQLLGKEMKEKGKINFSSIPSTINFFFFVRSFVDIVVINLKKSHLWHSSRMSHLRPHQTHTLL